MTGFRTAVYAAALATLSAPAFAATIYTYNFDVETASAGVVGLYNPSSITGDISSTEQTHFDAFNPQYNDVQNYTLGSVEFSVRVGGPHYWISSGKDADLINCAGGFICGILSSLDSYIDTVTHRIVFSNHFSGTSTGFGYQLFDLAFPNGSTTGSGKYSLITDTLNDSSYFNGDQYVIADYSTTMQFANASYSITTAPLPPSLLLLGAGALGLGIAGRRKSSRKG